MFEDKQVWVVGHNMAGYLPESAPSVFDDWEHAKESLLYDLGDNGLADYYAQGLEQVWLDFYNRNPGAGELILQLMESVRDGKIENSPVTCDDYQIETMQHMLMCDELIEEIKALDWLDEFQGYVDIRSYWMQRCDSVHELLKDNDMSPEEFGDVEEALEALVQY